MTHSGQLTDALAARTIAHDYFGRTLNPNEIYNDYFEAYGTARDVYAYDNALFANKLLSPPFMRTLLSPRTRLGSPVRGIARPRWGYLWLIGTAFGHRVVYTNNGGTAKEFQTLNMRFPDAGVTIVILSNNSQDNVEDIAIHIAALVFGQRLAPPPALVTSVPATLLGTYRRTFEDVDRRAARDPGLTGWVGGHLTLTIHKGWIDFGLPGGTCCDVAEYFIATPDGRLTMEGYLPGNQTSWCSYNPHLDPPTCDYRWKRQGDALTITTIKDAQCIDRPGVLPGHWTKIR
jgi:hypothetical protein